MKQFHGHKSPDLASAASRIMHSTTAQPVFFCCSVGALKSSPKSHSKEVGFALGQRSQASCKLRAYSQHKVLHLPAKARPAGSGEAEQNCSPACRRVLVAPCPPRAPTCSHRRRRRAWRRSCGPWRRRGTHTPCPLSAQASAARLAVAQLREWDEEAPGYAHLLCVWRKRIEG